MKQFTYSLTTLAICGLLSACGNSFQATQTPSAPTNQEEASSRFIIRGSAADTKAVINASSAYRVLNQKHNIYEVQGLNYFDIKEIAPSVSATQNQFFETQSNKLAKNPYSSLKKMNSEEEVQPEAQPEETPTENPEPAEPVTQAELPPAFEGCDVNAAAQPTPSLSVVSETLQTSPTMNLGESVTFSGIGSTSSDPEGDVQIQWDFIAPGGSEIEAGLRKGQEFEVKPDMVGLYLIVMVARDNTNACALVTGRFMVTHNPVIEFAQQGDEMPSIDLENPAFGHLKRIQAQEAWELATGKGMTIAVLDSGVHYNHLGIKFNLKLKEQELNGTEDQDDDGNTFKDDVLGWDFVNGDNLPFDDEGHGSHVAGLALSHLHGVARDAQLLPVKVLAASGGGDVGSVIAGIYYAADNGADVINSSLGSAFRAQIPMFIEALQYAHSKNIPFIAASGNDTLDLSLPENEVFPGELDVPNVVNVAAIGVDNNLASYSNFGKEQVDVAAPGGDQGGPLFSLATLNPRGAQFIGLGGTSMAAPVVAGVAALLKEAKPDITPEEVREILMASGQDASELSEVVASGKVLSALAAVESALTPQVVSHSCGN